MKVDLTQEQSRKVCFEHIATTLITMKQYMDDSTIRKYKFMLNEFGSLIEMEAAINQFNKSWPNDVRWDDV